MKTFNPEKELRKVQRGNKNKIIISVIAVLLIIAIGSSYALYQIRYNKQIIYTTVDNFSSNKSLAVYVDDVRKEEFPNKDEYYFDKVVCDNDSTWDFDYEKWELTLTTNKEDKCNVYFTKNYRDKSGANTPELYQGLIPIYFKDGNIYIADVEKKWYDYDAHEWGNAVLIDYNNKKDTFYKEDGTLKGGTQIQESDILQMYVWIPRYKYKIFSLGNTSTPKQIIEIAFEKGTQNTGNVSCSYQISEGTVTESCPGIEIGKWYTHPAFTFGSTDLKGFWVGKFEPSDPTNPNGRNYNNIGAITILPGKTSMTYKSISTAFYAEQSLSTEGNKYNLNPNTTDTRVMKNSEWGAVTYLTQSKYGIYTNDEEGCVIEEMDKTNCEVWINNTAQGKGTTGYSNLYGGTATGCVGTSVSAGVEWNSGNDGDPAVCPAGRRWNEEGVKASTTGNMYGIYDMSGGTWEYTMGVILQEGNTSVHLGNSGFTTTESATKLPEPKYYDVYTFDVNANTQERGHYGDATKEIMQTFGNLTGAWNGDYSYLLHVSSTDMGTWSRRGGMHGDSPRAGVLAFFRVDGSPGWTISFRSVLSAS